MDKPGILASLLRWMTAEEKEPEHKAAPLTKKWAEEEAKEHERPKPGMLGTGSAAGAAKSYRGRRGQIDKAIDEATGN